jgi:hypothetical protein
MHKSATKCNETIGKWCKNKHGASKIIDTFETYHMHTDGLLKHVLSILSFVSSAPTRARGWSSRSDVEVTEPDLEVLEGDAEAGMGEAATVAERFPLATSMPADASAVRSSFLATLAKDRPTLSFLQC